MFLEILHKCWCSLTNKAGNVKYVVPSILLTSLFINVLALAFPLALLQIYDRIIPNEAINTLLLLVMGVGIALIFEAILQVIRYYVSAWADAKFEHVTGCRVLAALLNSNILAFECIGSGIHLKRLQALNAIRDFYTSQAIITLADFPFVIILLGLFAYIAGWLVLLPITLLLIFVVMVLWNSKRLITSLMEKKFNDESRIDFVVETLSNIHSVKSQALEAQMLRRYEWLQQRSSVSDYCVNLAGYEPRMLSLLFSQLMLIFVVAFGALMVMKGVLTVGGLAACTLLSSRVLQPMIGMVNVWVRLQSVRIAQRELDQIITMPADVHEQLPALTIARGKIELHDVSFQYGIDQPWIIHQANYVIQPGEVVALSGDDFKGKSTLLWLMLGLLSPSAGKVLIDDCDIAQYDHESLRQQIAYLPEKSELFNGTIMENLTLFNEHEYGDRALEIVKQLHLTEIIEYLPQGYHTLVGDRVMDSLPRGIKQRIVIARALVRKPKIILLDKTNTTLDVEADMALINLLKEFSKQITVVLVTQRPSLLQLATRVITLEAMKQGGALCQS